MCCIEGSRPILVEVQALVSAERATGTPRRTAVGLDQNRAVAPAGRAGEAGGPRSSVGDDVFVNLAGGIERRRAGRRPRRRGGGGVERPQPRRSRRRRRCSARSAWPARCARTAQAARRVREAAQMGFTSLYPS
ncbi:MAG: hypothetical protein MZV63_56655 [Marinilabiliales bacterium]|nr:hypothetical protein [Marinilabiliales bacterium]